MPSTTTRIITVALAILAIAAPVAGASPMRDGSPAITPPRHHPDTQIYVMPDPGPVQQQSPTQQTKPHAPAVADSSDTSPLVYILPSLALVAMFGAAAVYVRGSRSPAQV